MYNTDLSRCLLWIPDRITSTPLVIRRYMMTLPVTNHHHLKFLQHRLVTCHKVTGICLTPQSQGSVLSPQQTQTVHQSDDVREDRSPGPLPQVDNSSNPTHNLQRSPSPASSPRLTDSMKHSHQFGSVTSSDSRSSPPDHSKAFQSPWLGKYSSSQSSNNLDFTCQAKYLVLQLLQYSTNEPHLLHLSQNSLSTTSESEPRF